MGKSLHPATWFVPSYVPIIPPLDTEESVYDSEWLASEFHGGGKDFGYGNRHRWHISGSGKERIAPDRFQVIYYYGDGK